VLEASALEVGQGLGALLQGRVVVVDEILGLKASDRTERSTRNRRLLRQVQALEKLSKRDQQALLRTIDAFLAKAG
jgi:hypothetical protein